MSEIPGASASTIKLRRSGAWRGVRVLAWDGNILYGCRGYEVVRLHGDQRMSANSDWAAVAHFNPGWWRRLTSRSTLGYRLVRDGFHALAILDSQTNRQAMIGAVPGAIVTCDAESDEFYVTHQIRRGMRPLHIATVPSGNLYWGEYFDNRERSEVHIYASTDRGRSWQIAHTFPEGSVRHVHNIVYDRWADCLWILTGDDGAECKVLRASCDLRAVETVLAGNQQARAVALLPTKGALYLSTDTPSEKNHIYRLDRAGNAERVGDLASSSIFGCKITCGEAQPDREALFFSTMVEPSKENPSRDVQLVGSIDGVNWLALARWKKDSLPMRYFQYGNAFLPDGENGTPYLATTTIAVESDDLVATLWEVDLA